MSELDWKKVFDAYYPLIAAAREVREYYGGKNKHKKPLVMPDVTGKLMIALREGERMYNVKLQVEETNDGEEKSTSEETKEIQSTD